MITNQRTVYLSLHSGYGTIVDRDGQPIEIQYYRDPNGRQPFIEWFESIRDKIRTYAILVEIEGFSTYCLMESWRKLDSPNFHSNFHSSLHSNRRRKPSKTQVGYGFIVFCQTQWFSVLLWKLWNYSVLCVNPKNNETENWQTACETWRWQFGWLPICRWRCLWIASAL